MAKRARGHVRPGRRRPIDRRPAPAATPAAAGGTTAPAAPRATGLTEAEMARAAELEAQLLAEERAAESARTQPRTQPRAKSMGRTGPSSLELRAEVEYAYVARDVREIVRIAALLFAVLFGLWIIIDVARIVPIG
jgi:hypothetical protein